jgi:nitrous oxidase accessory protein
VARAFFDSVLVVLLVLVACRAADGETLVVGQDQRAQFRSIGDAIASARPGDTIQVNAGLYSEQVAIDKRLTVEGIQRPVIRGERGSVITVLADGCTIRGFAIERSGNDSQKEDSGILLKSRGNRVEDNELRDVLFGIYLYDSGENIISRNTIRGRAWLDPGDRGSGLHFYNSPDNTIEDNIIAETRDGMYIQNSPGNTIRRNRVSNLRYGLHYMYSDANRFEDNVFAWNVAGAAIMYSNGIEFRRNAFIHNRGFSSFGILFQECNNCLAEENFIVDNATGLFMESVRQSTFRGNVIAENDVAILMFSSADKNVFTGNNFVENLSPLHVIGRSTTTRWSEDGRGNYWGNYDGYDLDADGIGDVPHKVQNVFEYMEGNHPRLRLYLNSPAAQALALAEKTFPVLKTSREIDGAPLSKPTPLRFPFESEKNRRSARLPVMLASLAISVAASWFMYRLRRHHA